MSDAIPQEAYKLLNEFADGVNVIVNDILGIYLTGSIALNDFHFGKSDIDFIVVCTTLPVNVQRQQLNKLHKAIEIKYNRLHLNGFYITTDALNFQNIESVITLHFHEDL